MAPELTALRCAFLVSAHHGRPLAPEALPAPVPGDMVPAVLDALRDAGFRGAALRDRGWDDAAGLGSAYPALAVRRDGSWVVLVHAGAGADGVRRAAVLDPAAEHEGVAMIPRERFLAEWSGTLVLCRPVAGADADAHAEAYAHADAGNGGAEGARRFGLRWFLPEIARHAALFRGVAVAAVMANLIALGTPLLFQVLIDKVVAHHAHQTLWAVVLIAVLLTTFEAGFGYARQHLLLIAGNKIDARLASRTFRHLLGLPMHFFEAHSAGVLARHLQQTEKLRHFLAGRLFGVLLDAAFLPVLILLLLGYSGLLLAVVLGFALLIAGVIGVLVPTFRRRLDLLYGAEGARQAFLVETLHGMRAVKSLALEPARARAWDERVATAVRRHAAVGRVGAAGGTLSGALERLMQVAVLAVGVTEVFSGAMTLGALIAFNMLSGRVTGPLVQLVALLNEFQEARMSARMLGTVMDALPENGSPGSGPGSGHAARRARPPVTGALEFRDVTYRYPGAAAPALEGVSFRVEPGQVIGVVGRSGSGKTTVTRLVQAIQSAQSGAVLLDGVDLRGVDLAHLRRHVGVVLQDNLLFRGTVRDNIAAARPEATPAEVLLAARMAGADEFVERLPLAYDTPVEENASNFSGGQRQRIAIARALLARPRLLIFDEATSALDPESEAVIQQHLSAISRDRTMLIVSHRLSSLVRADRTLVLERGRVADFAPHAVLLERCAPYRGLWQQQTRHLYPEGHPAAQPEAAAA